jgi:hypothetical protein
MAEARQIGAAPTALLRALAAGPQTRAEIRVLLGLDWRQTTHAARALLSRGYLTVLEGGAFGLTPAGSRAAEAGETIAGSPHGRVRRVRDTLRERAWSAMRVRRVFSIGDIVADAGRGEEARPRDNIARYIARLKAAGYVHEEARRQPGTAAGSNGFKRFRLLRGGPKAPVWRQETGTIHDPNTGEDLPCGPR